jgi:hypothetical protein
VTPPGASDGLAVLMMQMKDSLALAVLLTCVLCFPLHTHAGDASVQYDPHQLRAVEKRLREYLSKRVLVFRKGEIGRHNIKFDSRGQPATENGAKLISGPNAILFTDLTLSPERVLISGEAVRVRPSTSQLVLSRHHRELRVVTCTIVLDIPPDEITFTYAISILCRVFLTKDELKPVRLRLDTGR